MEHLRFAVVSSTDALAPSARVRAPRDATVQIRDARTDQLIVEHEITAVLHASNGPFVALESRGVDREDGWVIDLRSGSIRAYEHDLVGLSRSGHVAHRDDAGPLYWR